jgi:uncharacterized protein YfaT (DUF1175 family)
MGPYPMIRFLATERRNLGLPSEIDDCAALLRYSYREALHGHDAEWLLDQHLEGLTTFPSVQQYHYPQAPLEWQSRQR